MVLTSAQVLGDLIVFVNTFDPAVTTSTVTDTSGNAYSKVPGSLTDATLGYTQEIWYCLSAKAAGASANTITVHYSATTGGYSLATVYTYRATVGAFSLDSHNANNDTVGAGTSITSNTITTSNAVTVAVGFTAVAHLVTAGEGGWVVSAVDPFGDISEYLISTTIQTNIAATATQNANGRYICSVAAFAAAVPSTANAIFYGSD
jgi:hypothetical protein